jgi:hypothetical protein
MNRVAGYLVKLNSDTEKLHRIRLLIADWVTKQESDYPKIFRAIDEIVNCKKEIFK